MKIPRHIGIIMDGNGRWALRRGRPRVFGHIRGSSRVRPIIRECGRLGVKYLTLYAFSSENWGRPSDEVGVLMRLLQKYLAREQKTLMKDDVRFRTIGNVSKLPEFAQKIIYETQELTKANTGLTLIFALSYGSRQEITEAVRGIAELAEKGVLRSKDITEDLISDNLNTGRDIPDPDLIIRTSGEMRLSNFMLWQAAYSELYVTEKLWPEFDIQELHKAIGSFSSRKRRFGLTVEPVADEVSP